jgi:hypothetical protein
LGRTSSNAAERGSTLPAMTVATIIHLAAYIEPGDDVAPAGLVFLLYLIYLIFAVVFLGPLVPAFIDNWRRGIAPAFICACIGFLVGAVWPWGLDNTSITHPGWVRLAAGLLFGSAGWIAGAAIGWFHPRFGTERRARRASEPWIVLALIPMLAIMLLLARTTPPNSGPDLRSVFAGGEAIVAVTLLVFAQRNRFRQVGAFVGAIVALTIITRVAIGFSSAMPADRPWLDIWRSRQPDAASFAPNLLAPVSPVCPGAAPAFGRDPGFRYPDSHSSTWLDGHVPRWLPDDFGILTWWDVGPFGGQWADRGCGLVRLTLEEGEWAPKRPLLARDDVDRIGHWYVWERLCPRRVGRNGPCLVYRAGFQSGGLVLWTWGLDRDVADRIALGISVPTRAEVS